MRRPTCAILLCLLVLPIGGCRKRNRATPSAPMEHARAAHLRPITHGDAEARYRAIRALSRHDGESTRSRLRALLAAEEPLTRNAAARTLGDLGEEAAARVLIANLHRDQRTYVTMDAIHHLRALFGTDLGYDANKGYRHQTETLEAWWRWWEARGHARGTAPEETDEHAAARKALTADVTAYAADDAATWKDTQTLWKGLAEIAPSRRPDDVAVVARGFGAMVERFPDQVDLTNNFALASLNDGRYDVALEAYARALASTPDNAQLHNDLGILLEALGRMDEAADAYREATRREADDDVPWANLGDVSARLGKPSDALRAWRRAERLAPEKWYYHRLWIRRLVGDPHAACSRD